MNLLHRLGLVSTLALLACDAKVQGNGEQGVEHRSVAPFDEVEVSLGIEATLTANAEQQPIALSGDSNLLPFISTPVEAGVLKTRLRVISGIDPVTPLRLVAQDALLRRVKASEAAIVEVKGAGSAAEGFAFEVEAEGQSSVQLGGSGAHLLQVKLSGGSALDASGWPAGGANVLLTGGSRLQVRTSGELVGTAADKSSVVVTGGGSCAGLLLSGAATCQAQ
jgi:hypothetical protein